MKKTTIAFILIFLAGMISADYSKEIQKLAGQLAKKVPKQSTVVVLNFTNALNKETVNGVDIAKKIGGGLVSSSKKKFQVINREEGQNLYYEERKYHFYNNFSEKSDNLQKVIKGFAADIAVTGEYLLTNDKLILKNVCLMEIPSETCQPVLIESYPERIISLTAYEIDILNIGEYELPQPPSKEIDEFIRFKTENNWVSMELVDLDDKSIESKQVKVGEFYRIKIKIQEPSYIYVFSYDQDKNNIYYLYPNPTFDFDNKLQTEEAILIPNGKKKAIQAMPPAGKNLIKVIASKKPLDIEIPSDVSNYKYQIDELGRVLDVLKNSPSDSWSECKFYLEIAE